MTETTTEYAVKNLRSNKLCVPSEDGTHNRSRLTGDLFEAQDRARQYIRNKTGCEPENSHLQVLSVEPAHQE